MFEWTMDKQIKKHKIVITLNNSHIRDDSFKTFLKIQC